MKLLLENFIAESMVNKFPYLWPFIAAACFFIVAYRYIFHRYCLYLGNDYDPQNHISGITYLLTVGFFVISSHSFHASSQDVAKQICIAKEISLSMIPLLAFAIRALIGAIMEWVLCVLGWRWYKWRYRKNAYW